jgi:hypothetical protein
LPPTGWHAACTQRQDQGTWVAPARASLRTASLQEINMSAAFISCCSSVSGNSPPFTNPQVSKPNTGPCPEQVESKPPTISLRSLTF